MASHPAPAAAGTPTFQELAAEVDRAIAEAGRLDGPARETAQALQGALERFHAVGLRTIVRRLRGDAAGKALLFDLMDEPEVRALLSLHGLIRRPAPDDAPAAAPPPAPIAAVIPLATLRTPPLPGWTPGPPVADVPQDRPYRLDVRDTSVVLVRIGDDLQAFRNECAHQGLPIDGGRIDRESRTLTCPWHGFRFDCATGECLTSPHVQLEAVPVRVEQGIVHVRVG